MIFYNISNGQDSIEQIGEEEQKITLYDKNHNEVFSEVTLTDIFKKAILHQEVVRDFSVCVNPMSAVTSVEMINDMNMRLGYLEGTDYTAVSETI